MCLRQGKHLYQNSLNFMNVCVWGSPVTSYGTIYDIIIFVLSNSQNVSCYDVEQIVYAEKDTSC